jgi:hypothetical protein
MLSFAEEIILIALDEQRGDFDRLPDCELAVALVGAVLMELAFLNRIDVDNKSLLVVDGTPTGSAVLDASLEIMKASRKEDTTSYWLRRLAGQANAIRQEALEQLVRKGVLRREESRVFWIFPAKRYPALDNQEIKAVEARLRELILGGDIPDPRDAVLVSLINACHLFRCLFSAAELERVRPRINDLAKLDLIGQSVVRSIRDIEAVLSLPLGL